MNLVLEELYSKTYKWEHKGRDYSFNLQQRKLKDGFPSNLNVSKFNCLRHYRGSLSGRMLSNILYQLTGILKGELQSSKSLKHRFEIPSVLCINPEIYPKHINMIVNENEDSEFQLYVEFVNFTRRRNQNIILPIHLHEMDEKHSKRGILMNSILLMEDRINIRYKYEGLLEEKNDKIKVIGGDTGINKVCTLSDGQMTKRENNQHKTFTQLVEKIYRKEFNSKGYKRSLKELKDFYREVLNGLDFSGVKEFRLESNKGIKTSIKHCNKYWQREVTNRKLLYMSQENGVDLVSTLPQFKSVRCPNCDFSHKSNRHKEVFKCQYCSYSADADYVSSINNSIDLPYVDLWIYRDIAKTSGFFWSMNGITIADGDLGCIASPN